MRYYRATILLFGLLFGTCVVGFFGSAGWLGELRAEREIGSHALEEERRTAALAVDDVRRRENAAQSWIHFVEAWEPYVRPAGAGKDLGNFMREGLTALATSAALTSEGATVSVEPKNYQLGRNRIYVETASLTVVGDSLPALVAWLGAAEEKFPFARIETLSLSAYGSRSIQLGVTLVYPVEETTQGTVSLQSTNLVVNP